MSFSPVLGALSDHYGRRPVVLLSSFGLALDYIVMALAPTVPVDELPPVAQP
jgi:DHA1 family tetracycline resistance protein-like MFS transporter